MRQNLYLFHHLAKTTNEAARACKRCSGNNRGMHNLARQLRELSPEGRGGTKELAYAIASDAAQIGAYLENDGDPGQWWLAQAIRLLALAWAVVFANGNDGLQDAFDLLDEAQDYLQEGMLEISRWNQASKSHR